MNARLARKLRQLSRRDGKAYLKEIKSYDFITRCRLAWWILFGKTGV